MPMKLAAHDSILKFPLKQAAERPLRVLTEALRNSLLLGSTPAALGTSPGVAGAQAPRTLQKTASLATNPSPQSSSPPGCLQDVGAIWRRQCYEAALPSGAGSTQRFTGTGIDGIRLVLYLRAQKCSAPLVFSDF